MKRAKMNYKLSTMKAERNTSDPEDLERINN